MLVNAIWSPIQNKGRTSDLGRAVSHHPLDCRRAARPAENGSFYADLTMPTIQDLRLELYGIDRHTLRDKSQAKTG